MGCILGACILAAQLTTGGTYNEVTPKSAIDTADITHDISNFYTVENTQFKLGGYLVLDTDTRINLLFDNGLESQKRERGKALTIGLTQLKVIDKDTHMTYGFSTKLGGKTNETACTDDSGLNRQFFCDNLATLEPFKQPKNDADIKFNI